MKMLNAYTLEADDRDLAVAEILQQLDLDNQLQQNAVGFITCSYDYVETGILEAICQALPFDIIGGTTLTNAIDAEAGTMLLALSVLTADDCCFATAVTEPITDANLETVTEQAYNAALSRLQDKPKLALAFFPMISAIGGELLFQALNKPAAAVPIFGTLVCDFDTANYAHSFTIHNGSCYKESTAFLLVGGNVEPRFVVSATSEQNLHKQQAIITASEGSLLQEVNGMTARDYLSSIGVLQQGGVEGLSSVPFVVNFQDGTQPVARAIYSIDENGAAVCGGLMPKGCTLSIGRLDIEDIFTTARNSLNKLLLGAPVNGIIMFPCLGRNMVLGTDPLSEAEVVRETIPTDVPWHLAYSGGEVCPVYGQDGKTVNRFHNFTFIACAI